MRNLAEHLPKSAGFDLKHLLVEPGKKISLSKDFDPKYTGDFKEKEGALAELKLNVEWLAAEQDVLYAANAYAVLIVLQALDAAGKDGTIKHVMSGVNPQGCDVHSFKAPSQEELSHDYLWRAAYRLPQSGHIGIFNRSYYEDVLVVRVHPELLAQQHLPPLDKDKSIWKRRFKEINSFERYLVRQRNHCPEIFLEHFEVGTESPISQADRTKKRKTGSFRPATSGNADIGTTT